MLVTPLSDKMYIPKLWLLNQSASGLDEELLIDTGRSVNSNNKEGMDKKGPLPLPKKEPPGKKIVENPNVGTFSNDSLGQHLLSILFSGLHEPH